MLGGLPVAMCGGGMDLTPQLIATFINLGKGVPVQLAMNMRKHYQGYVNKDVHAENCELVGKALQEYGKSISAKGITLENNEATVT